VLQNNLKYGYFAALFLLIIGREREKLRRSREKPEIFLIEVTGNSQEISSKS